jgi:hypothetical protein
MKRFNLTILLIMVLTLNVWGISILTPYTESKLQNIEPGKQYKLRDAKNRPLKIKNTGTSEVLVNIEVQKINPDNLKEYYESIPDINWIHVNANSLSIKPNSWGQTELEIEVPRDKRFYGKKYQAQVLIKTSGSGKLQAGLRSNIYFTVVKKKSLFKKLFGNLWK